MKYANLWKQTNNFRKKGGKEKEKDQNKLQGMTIIVILTNMYIQYNFRAEQRVSSNLIGCAIPYMTLYLPRQTRNITFLRPSY